jgi:hypothetical protein
LPPPLAVVRELAYVDGSMLVPRLVQGSLSGAFPMHNGMDAAKSIK